MANLFKQVAFAAVVVGLTIATGGAFAGLSAGGAGFFGGIANAFVSIGLKGFATRVATQFLLGAALGALARASAKEQIAGTLVSGRDPIASRKVIYGTRRVGGTQVFLGTDGAENKFLYMVIALAGHEVHRIREVYFGEDRVYYWDGSNHVKDTTAPQYDAGDQELFNIEFYDGADDQAASTQLVNTFADWTTDHRLRGVAYIMVQLKYSPDKFPTGIPNITALVDGKEVYDSVNEVTGHSDNAAMCILDYLRNDEYGLGVADSEIDFTSFNEAIVLCNEQVALDAGGTEDRYTINGVVDTSASPKQVIEEMLLSMGGKLVYAAGKFKLIGAEYRTPTVTLDEDDIISDITVITKNSARDFYNGVRGIFSNPDNLYQPTEYPTIESSSYQSIDGLTRYANLDLPYTTSSATAQRLAKVLLNQSRQEITIQMRCKLSALNITVGDNIYVNNTRLGFSDKVFEVGSVAISPEADGTLGVDIMAREINESTYDWTATDEQALIANAAPYTDNFAVPAPTNLAVTSSLVSQPSGVQEVSWEISWTASTARNLLNYEVLWKKSSETSYKSSYTTETSVSGIGGVESGETYDVRVRAISSKGAKSAFVATSHSMAGGMNVIGGVDTKTASGYVYYQSASSSSPSTPSASSFNFSTLALSGLTSGWASTPPQISDNADQYWAAQYNVEDIDGSQTIVFSSPFRSFYFDGLVTFTNLNNELADENSTEITTISGGLIKTGVVDADRIELDGNTIEAGGSGIQIKNLGVDTLQIADNAVTVPDAAFTISPTSITTSGAQYFVVQQLSVSSIGNVPNLITFSCHAFTNTKEQFVAGLAVNRGGSTTFLLEIGSYSVNSSNEILPNTTISGSVVHTPSTTGTDVYQVFLYHGQSGKILRANARSISRLTVKK